MESEATPVLSPVPDQTNSPPSILRARSRKGENPVWLRTRPRNWRPAQAWLYRGVVAGGWTLLLVTVAWPLHLQGKPDPGIVISLTGALAFVQCYVTMGLVQSFDFLAGRRSVLEELTLTELDIYDIALGSYDRGIATSIAVLFPMFCAEIFLWFWIDETAGLFSLFGIFPFRWILNAYAVRASLNERSSFRAFNPVSLVWTPVKCMLWILFWFGIVVTALTMLAFVLIRILRLDGEWLQLLALLVPFYPFVLAYWGTKTHEKGWRMAVRNLQAHLGQ